MSLDREKKLIKDCLRKFNEQKNFEFTKRPSLKQMSRMNIDSKVTDISEQARDDGNKLYIMRTHDYKIHFKILELYNKSIAYAPSNSEALATAYANKSALLQHICRYRNSISEIDKAFKITKSTPLKIKLLCRRAKCLTSLGSSDNRKYLEKAKFWLNKFYGNDEKRKNLLNLIAKAEQFVAGVNDETLKLYKENAKLSKKVSRAEVKCGNYVDIRYSKEHGPYLTALRDIEPGEIFVVENTFSFLNPSSQYVYCSHCTSFLWEIEPCSSCPYICYCSEKCKMEAWKQYHDVECGLIPIIAVIDEINHRLVHRPCARLGLRIFLTALKDAGEISALKNILKIAEANRESLWKSTNIHKIDDYRHVYTLSSHISEEMLHSLVEEITIYLIILAKYTAILKEYHSSINFGIEKLMRNDNVLYVGALIVRFAAISQSRYYSTERRPSECDSPLHNPSLSGGIGCCTISIALGVKTSLTHRSCAPNAKRCIIDDNRIMMYALQPIQKGAKITDGQPNITNDVPTYVRQDVYMKRTGLNCDCQVCKDDWPVTNYMELLDRDDVILPPKSMELLNKIKLHGVKIGGRDEVCLEAKTVTEFSKIVKDAIEYSPLPSKLSTLAILQLTLLMEITHGFSKSIVPDKCCDST